MTRFATTLTSLAVTLSAAAYAGTPAPAALRAATAAKSPVPHPTSLTYSNTSSLFGDASDPDVPGATGRTIVPGTNSTIAGDSMATRMERTGALNAN